MKKKKTETKARTFNRKEAHRAQNASELLSTLNFRLSTSLNKKFFFLLFARLIPASAPAPRPQKIQADLNSLHQRRRLLHRPPEIVLEFRARILHGLKRSRQDAIRMHQLSAKPVRRVGQHAVEFLR